MLDALRFCACAILCGTGLFCLVSGVVGVFRFKYALSRIHAAALFDTLGIMLLLAGVMVAEGLTVAALKMLVVVIFLWLSSPVCSHLIGRLEVTVNDDLASDMAVIDPETVQHEKEV